MTTSDDNMGYMGDIPPEYLSKEFDHSKLSPTEDWVMRFARETKDSKMQYVVILNNGSVRVMLVDEDSLRTMKLGAEDRIHRLGPEVRVKTVIEPVKSFILSSTRGSFRESS